jgi:hypothetical protein
MTRMEKRKLERVQYWQGQRLRSGDFRDVESVEAQRRWWHNRAIHQAYGVYEGFHASASPLGIQNGVTVTPGIAYDCFGHELILERPLTVPLPINLRTQKASSASLLIRYCAPRCDIQAARISDICFTQENSISAGTVELVWKLTECAKPSDGVPIGELISANGIYSAENRAVRLAADFRYIVPRPIASPILISGTTIPGNTAWEPWNFMGQGLIGVQTFIDTSAAGFTNLPCYFAWLEGSVWKPQTLQLVPAIFPSLANESVTGFTFRLWLEFPEQTFDLEDLTGARQRSLAAVPSFNFVTDPDDFALFAQQQNLYVSWIACQMPVSISCCTRNGSDASADQTSGSAQIT